MRISVIGTGGVGGYYGMMMANAGHEVHFLLRSDYDYVKKFGLRLHSSVHQNISIPKVNAYREASEMPETDIIFVSLKTTMNRDILPAILNQLETSQSLVVLIQNGLGMEEELSKRLPFLQIAGGVALIGSHKSKNGVINHQDYGSLDIGNYNVREPKRLEILVDQLRGAEISSDNGVLDVLRWKKLVWNLAFNGLSVVLNKTTDQIIANKNYLDRCQVIMKEVISAAHACDIAIPIDFDSQMIEFTKKMRPYTPSMKHDFDNGKPLELEYLYENPLKRSYENGYEMSETKALYQELRGLTM